MANEILASLDDINVHLPDDKAKMQDSEDNELQIDAARYIRSLLAGFFSAATLVSWDSPADTPELIRGIAGRLIASKYYATLYSEDVGDVSAYAQWLYNQANLMLDQVRTGTLTLLDATDTPIPIEGGISLDSDDFYPNDSAGEPHFGVGLQLS